MDSMQIDVRIRGRGSKVKKTGSGRARKWHRWKTWFQRRLVRNILHASLTLAGYLECSALQFLGLFADCPFRIGSPYVTLAAPGISQGWGAQSEKKMKNFIHRHSIAMDFSRNASRRAAAWTQIYPP